MRTVQMQDKIVNVYVARSPGTRCAGRQTGIRDFISGEKVVQGFLAAYLSVTDYYVFRSEAELGKGYADICLEPMVAHYPHLRHGYLIELKHLNRRGRLQRSERLQRGSITNQMDVRSVK